MLCTDSSLVNHIIQRIEVSHVAFCTTACLEHAQCKSYNFQETENAAKSCELSSSTESFSSSDLVSRDGYSYYDAEVIVLRSDLVSTNLRVVFARP